MFKLLLNLFDDALGQLGIYRSQKAMWGHICRLGDKSMKKNALSASDQTAIINHMRMDPMWKQHQHVLDRVVIVNASTAATATTIYLSVKVLMQAPLPAIAFAIMHEWTHYQKRHLEYRQHALAPLLPAKWVTEQERTKAYNEQHFKLGLMAASRSHEYEADAGAVAEMLKMGYTEEEIMIGATHFFSPHKSHQDIMSSHPSDSSRLLNIKHAIALHKMKDYHCHVSL